MKDCPQCHRARQIVVHKVFEDGCMGCGARKLAYMPREERERTYDAIQFISGHEMRREAERLVALERARIQALSEANPKEKDHART